MMPETRDTECPSCKDDAGYNPRHPVGPYRVSTSRDCLSNLFGEKLKHGLPLFERLQIDNMRVPIIYIAARW